MKPRQPQPIVFMRGNHLVQIARTADGKSFVGYRDGRLIAAGAQKADVAKALILAP